MNVAFKIYDYVKSAIPWFLRRSGSHLYWQDPNGDFWVDPNGWNWDTGDSDENRHSSWIRSLVKPLQVLNDSFKTYSNTILYHLHLTGQVVYLEHYLNDQFDRHFRRVWIEDGTIILPPYLYNKADNAEPIYLDEGDPLYLYNVQDYYTQNMFIVHIPADLPLNQYIENRIRACVNRYKQAGVFYTIVND